MSCEASERRPAPTLVRCGHGTATKSAVPIFVVHGFQCDLTFARLLAPWLSGAPTYGYQGFGIDGICTPLDTIEAMAACFLKATMTQYANGPFFLVGFCAGAQIALEMARQLDSEGRLVEHVFLIDAPNRMRSGAFDQLASEQVETAERRLQLSAHQRTKFPGAPAVILSFAKALKAYTPKHYGGRVQILATEEQLALITDANLGWAGLLPSNTAVHIVARNRNELLTRRMPAVARIIRSEVEKYPSSLRV